MAAFFDKVSYIGGLLVGLCSIAYLLLLLLMALRMGCDAIIRRIENGKRR